jgi:hypothetical protein
VENPAVMCRHFGLIVRTTLIRIFRECAKGMVGAQFWSVWIPGETTADDARRMQLEQIETAQQIIDTHPDTFELALTANDIERMFGPDSRTCLAY